MDILTTIIPIFTIILLGWLARQKGFLPPEFLGPANGLVYHFAIPAMIFNSISRAPVSQQFDFLLIGLMLISAIFAYMMAWLTTKVLNLPLNQRGTFIQCSGHGNLGYIGLAVAFYYLGDSGLARAGVAAGFLMIVQNLLSVIALQIHSNSEHIKRYQGQWLLKVIGNPVILAAMAGIGFSALGFKLPLVVQRSLEILSGMALPTALLLIGATLSFDLIRKYFKPVLGAALIKLIILPAVGLALFHFFHIPAPTFMPALILLASPPATIAYVMAREMQGDSNVAVAGISAVTLLSALSFTFWLHLAA